MPDLDKHSLAPMRAPLRWLWLALAVIVVDLGTKALASSLLVYAQPVVVIEGFFDLTLLHNYGAAFSFLADHSGWQRWLFALIAVGAAVGLSVWMSRLKQGETLVAVALALIIGGAVGNLFDRMVHGYVVDFFSFHWRRAYYYPAFNIADSAICVGAVGLIWDALRGRRGRQEEEQS
ncbi:signal peptidase II [Halotalea alkalilenta]|uniref:Lipoprotein signal peptidase n=1 Tax=Halotalea alkalilenta TaxID=376489 RepID=A0A172YJC1_9GAMM|nr:signal peptidase II [Halotalea alkalilenta]ANF59310.1 signal peptidase II [Halotalea alkalilenta]